MALPRRPEELQGQEGAHGRPAGIISDPGKPRLLRIRSQGGRAKVGRKRNKSAELGVQVRGAEIEPAGVGDVGGDGTGLVGRSSSPRRGRRANPSSLRILAMAAGLSDLLFR